MSAAAATRSVGRREIGFQQDRPPDLSESERERHGKQREERGGRGLSRRDFLKVSAAGAAGGAAGFDWAVGAASRSRRGSDGARLHVYHTTCPYCSASCGQIVAVRGRLGRPAATSSTSTATPMSPINQGGLCAKGAGAYQHVTNTRRLGAFAGTHPVNPKFAVRRHVRPSGVAYKRDRQRRLGRRWRSTRPWTRSPLALEDALAAPVTGRQRLQQQGRRVPRLFAHEQRAELHVPQAHRAVRHEQHRASGPYMTLVHGGRSGRRIRTRLDDEQLDRYRQRVARSRLGRQPR